MASGCDMMLHGVNDVTLCLMILHDVVLCTERTLESSIGKYYKVSNMSTVQSFEPILKVINHQHSQCCSFRLFTFAMSLISFI